MLFNTYSCVINYDISTNFNQERFHVVLAIVSRLLYV